MTGVVIVIGAGEKEDLSPIGDFLAEFYCRQTAFGIKFDEGIIQKDGGIGIRKNEVNKGQACRKVELILRPFG